MRLGIDLDGVVANFNAGWRRVFVAEHERELDLATIESAGWDGLADVAGFADMDEFWRWAAPKPHRRSIFRHLDTYPGAVDALRNLDTDGHDIVIVTTKPRWARTDTLHWIADHELPTGEVHIVDDKYRVDCDAYLDDGPHVLSDLVRHRPDRLVCRYVRPWNDPVDGAVDVRNWSEFAAAVSRATVDGVLR